MKKIMMLVLALAMVVSIDAFAQPNRGGHGNSRPGHGNSRPGSGNSGSVGAPLDGGALAILGAAGVAYLVSKKKKEE